MEIATYLLFALGIGGAVDILLYHSISHGIRKHVDSRQELIIHSLRGPTYAALFLLVPNFQLHGAWFWLLVAIFVFDVAVSIWDFAIERHSREFFGGLPSGEYVLHMLIAMLFGAMVATACVAACGWALLPSAIPYAPAQVPALLRLVMAVMATMVLYSGALDALAVRRLGTVAGVAQAKAAAK